MVWKPGLAVQGMLLVLALPAAARGQNVEAGETRHYGPLLAPPATERPRPVAVGAAPDAPAAAPERTHLFASVPLEGNAQLGVGLFTVPGATEAENIRRRTDPDPAIHTPETRVAAVGFSLPF
ncbi:MAG: hypothetical protein QOH04_84 [Sphingomonadales bacterium]|nr:hypothetical protein [Sphingomonadales bacterium]MEA3034333.1 hypothetical protein [Sphingomonadales bacterium]